MWSLDSSSEHCSDRGDDGGQWSLSESSSESSQDEGSVLVAAQVEGVVPRRGRGRPRLERLGFEGVKRGRGDLERKPEGMFKSTLDIRF
jgi:hypothetical protein